MSEIDLSVVIPVFKNRSTLESLYHRLRNTLETENVAFELIFVNDACPAGSLETLRKLASRDDRVLVVALAENVGQHRAILEGLKRAQGHNAVVLDADLQDPPEAIPLLLEKLEEGKYAAVFAGRRGHYEATGRLMTSRIFKCALSLLADVPRDAGAFVAMNSEMVEQILSFRAERPFLTAMIGCAGRPVISIPVERSIRPEGRSAYSPAKRLKVAVNALLWVAKTKMQLHRKERGL